MNQLKSDYRYLRSKGINKPSQNNLNKKELGEEVFNTVRRYKHLLLNKLILKQNGIDANQVETKAIEGKKNGKKTAIEKYGVSGICISIIAFPLVKMNQYILENIDYLRGDNTKQIEVAKKFELKNLGDFYRAIKSLGLIDELKWSSIDMSVEKFEVLISEIKKIESTGVNISGENFLDLGKRIGIANPEILHTGLSAIGITQKYGLNKIRTISYENADKIKEYAFNKYCLENKKRIITDKELTDIAVHFSTLFKKGISSGIKKVRSVLNFYGFNIVETSKNYT